MALAQKRDATQGEMETLRGKVGEWEGALTKARKATADYLSDVDKVAEQLVTIAKEMHEQVEVVLAQSLQTLEQICEPGLTKLSNQEEYLENMLSQLKRDLEKYEDQPTDDDSNASIHFKHPQEKPKLPSLETVPRPSLTKAQNDVKTIQKMFGQLSIQAIRQKKKEVAKKDRDGQPSQQPAISLIPNPTVLSQADVDTGYPSISCVDQSLAWVRTEEKELQLMDRGGSVTDTINTDFDIYDTALTSDGELLLTDITNNSIRSVTKTKKINTLFKTTWRPFGLCCLPNNDIVVSFCLTNEVTVYKRNGKIRKKLDKIKFRHPLKVTVNKVNKNIYICDKETIYDGSTGKVIAVGSDGKLRYEYAGQGDIEFTPADVCTDQMGHVLITDIVNHQIHILDQEGQFIRYIMTSQQGLRFPNTIAVDTEGYVWVGEQVDNNKGCVKVARYLQ